MNVDVQIYYGVVGQPQQVELIFSTEDMLIRIPHLTFESCEAFIDDIKEKLHDAKATLDAYEHTRYGDDSEFKLKCDKDD